MHCLPRWDEEVRASNAANRRIFRSVANAFQSSAWGVAALAACWAVSVGFIQCAGAQETSGEIDVRPLKLAIEPAFPHVTWPDSLTGASRGQQIDVRPLVVTGANDRDGAIFVATQHGTIHRIPSPGFRGEAPMFLDLRDRVEFKPEINEEGFLGLAFHPRFAENGQFVVYYTPKPSQAKGDPEHAAVISRFRVDADDPTRGDPASEEVLLKIDEPYWNHNGGTVVFGPDGFLYIGTGDGGAANDPHMNGQNLQTWLGKILRVDVDRVGRERPYAIPEDNPFANERRLARPEIWAYGLRNVWRLSFDRETGICWAGDVGQDLWEEVNLIERGGNYGWNLREGRHPFGPGGVEASSRLIDPIWEYHHDVGKSITGGVVYRGKDIPELVGCYLYGDYVTGQVAALKYDFDRKRVTAVRTLQATGRPVMTFGEDDAGEVFFATQQGDVFKLGPAR